MRALLLLLLVLITPCRAQDKFRSDAVKDPKLRAAINRAISRGAAWLKSAQHKKGYWSYSNNNNKKNTVPSHGITALCVYALAASGVRADDPAIERGVRWMLTHGKGFEATAGSATYSTSLLILALARVDATRHAGTIRKLAKRVYEGQGANGAWGYQLRSAKGGGDLSNSQFAIMALWTAATKANAKIPREVWERVRHSLERSQGKRGGWSYGYQTRAATPSMTAAGLFGYVVSVAALNGGVAGLPKARESKRAIRGQDALLTSKLPYPDYYYCYGLERAAAAKGIPAELWYVDGARYLVKKQAGTGAWSPEVRSGRIGRGGPTTYCTPLALLFLTRATSFVITPRKMSGAVTARASAFPQVVTPKNLKRAFEAYLLADAASRKTLAPRFGAAGPAAIGLFVKRLGDPEAAIRVVAHELLRALLDKRLLFDPKGTADERKIMLGAVQVWWEREGGELDWDAGSRKFR